jgi:hypothetical protein
MGMTTVRYNVLMKKHLGKLETRRREDEVQMDHKEEGYDGCLSKTLGIDNVRIFCYCSAYNLLQTMP